MRPPFRTCGVTERGEKHLRGGVGIRIRVVTSLRDAQGRGEPGVRGHGAREGI